MGGYSALVFPVARRFDRRRYEVSRRTFRLRRFEDKSEQRERLFPHPNQKPSVAGFDWRGAVGLRAKMPDERRLPADLFFRLKSVSFLPNHEPNEVGRDLKGAVPRCGSSARQGTAEH